MKTYIGLCDGCYISRPGSCGKIIRRPPKLLYLVLRYPLTCEFCRKRVENETGMKEVLAAFESGETLDAYITEVVSKGLVANYKGARVFSPGSQATLRRGEPFDQLLHTHQNIRIIEADKDRRRVIGSIRSVLEEENSKKKEEFFQTVEVGKVYQGKVKSLTNYGAFIDLGGVDGMVHVSEMSWKRIHNPSEVFSVGDDVEVFVQQ